MPKNHLMLLAIGLLGTACGRSPVEQPPCFGEACPCVFDSDCSSEQLCVNSVCVGREDFERCVEQGVQPEICNGIDDDCDGRTDESLGARPCSREAQGLVCTGTERCMGESGWRCDALTPRPEVCDGVDDDCDGTVDQPFITSGLYLSPEHCGACGRDCAELVSLATETACEIGPEGPRCVALRCGDGRVPSEDRSRCVTPLAGLCRACVSDEECPGPGARCLVLSDGERACGRDCGPNSPFGGSCPMGFSCQLDQCTPLSGTCSCGADQLGARRSCLVPPACEGIQTCGRQGGQFAWSTCDISAARETCDGLDNDCDGVVDDGFVDGAGRYTSDLHCGVCNNDCTRQWVEAIDHAVGACDASGGVPECAIARCTEEVVGDQRFEWVNVDGLSGNGCECRRRAGNLAFDPPDLPGVPTSGDPFEDENCDGVDGVIGEAVFVSAAASGGDGSIARPFSSLAAGLAQLRRDSSKRYVLVAEGVYVESIQLSDGDAIHGGYANNFRTRDIVRFASILRAPTPGQPSLRASGVGRGTVSTVVSGMHLVAPDVSVPPQEGGDGVSTMAVLFDRCGPQLSLRGSVIRGGRAGAGGRGAVGQRGSGRQDSMDVDGVAGTNGRPVMGTCASGTRVAGGRGGLNRACLARGRNGGTTGCPEFDFSTTPPTGQQVQYRTPTTSGDGAGGFAWSYDRLSGPSCSHVTESGFPSNVQDNNGLDGRDGRDGVGGADGQGCGRGFGVISMTGQWNGLPGADGLPGSVGQPGGGGGAGAGTARFFRNSGDCPRHELGGSGGGGGAGGCGGGGGRGGRPGGASFAVLVTSSNTAVPVIRDNHIERGRGGNGGSGGFGGSGGEGGRGGFGGRPTTWSGSEGGKGGDGGNGGRGGTGGGGCGGPSVGVVVVGPASGSTYQTENRFEFPDNAPLGGLGGTGVGNPGRGGPGLSAQVFEVPL